jgi:hypothetical protein
MLSVADNECSSEGAGALGDALKSVSSSGAMSCLTHLNVAQNSIGPSGATALAQALRNNVALKVLNLDANRIGDGGAQAVAAALKVNAGLTHVVLGDLGHMVGGNQIGKQGAQWLAEALTVNVTLTKYDGPGLTGGQLPPLNQRKTARQAMLSAGMNDLWCRS